MCLLDPLPFLLSCSLGLLAVYVMPLLHKCHVHHFSNLPDGIAVCDILLSGVYVFMPLCDSFCCAGSL